MEFNLEVLRNEISQARDPDALREVRDRIHEIARSYPLSTTPEAWNAWMNAVHDDFIRYAVKRAEWMVEESGLGPPPKQYAMLLFGSGGRREQTLWSDQDNGLVYEDPEADEAERVLHYFQTLSQTVVEVLFQLGYPPCEGNVMCNNPIWGQRVSGWNAMIEGWMEDPNWENVRYLLIMADARCISGYESLADAIKAQMLERVAADRMLLGAMLRNTLRRKASLGVLGNLIPERFGEDMGGIDIKYGAYIPLVNAIRLLAVRYGIPLSGTLERIAALQEKGAADASLCDSWRTAFNEIIRMRSLTSFKLEDGYYHSSGVLPGALLSRERKKELKSALRTAQKLHKYVEKEINSLEIEKG
jgi:CBS domain-containing protein